VLEDPNAELQVDLAMAQLLGIAYRHHILRVEPIASKPTDELVARIAPVICGRLGAPH
jgi:Tetracyclin repressor-like, C-terminal domain